jgi:hypothetical protein
MQDKNTIRAENNQNVEYNNSLFGIVALILVLFSALGLHNLLMSLVKDNNRIEKLWEPKELSLFFAVPIFIMLSLFIIWILSPKSTHMRKIFKIASIIGFILFVIYALCIAYLYALGSGMKN